MASRFYLTDIGTQQQVTLEGTEAHHLLHVLRLKVGAEVELFDGAGNAWIGIVEETSRKTVEIQLEKKIDNGAEPERQLILASAAPKGDRFRWMVEKATELGVDVLQPLATERSVVDPGAGKLNKLTQTMIGACKQCQRNRLMEIREMMSWPDCLARYSGSAQILLAHPSGKPVREVVAALREDQDVVIAIGPEGGWTEEELALGEEQGVHQVQMGHYIQRIETAAISMAAQFL